MVTAGSRPNRTNNEDKITSDKTTTYGYNALKSNHRINIDKSM